MAAPVMAPDLLLERERRRILNEIKRIAGTQRYNSTGRSINKSIVMTMDLQAK